jgi:hypothetical protein
MTPAQMLEMSFYHPVIEEGLRTALRVLDLKLRAAQANLSKAAWGLVTGPGLLFYSAPEARTKAPDERSMGMAALDLFRHSPRQERTFSASTKRRKWPENTVRS